MINKYYFGVIFISLFTLLFGQEMEESDRIAYNFFKNLQKEQRIAYQDYIYFASSNGILILEDTGDGPRIIKRIFEGEDFSTAYCGGVAHNKLIIAKDWWTLNVYNLADPLNPLLEFSQSFHPTTFHHRFYVYEFGDYYAITVPEKLLLLRLEDLNFDIVFEELVSRAYAKYTFSFPYVVRRVGSSINVRELIDDSTLAYRINFQQIANVNVIHARDSLIYYQCQTSYPNNSPDLYPFYKAVIESTFTFPRYPTNFSPIFDNYEQFSTSRYLAVYGDSYQTIWSDNYVWHILDFEQDKKFSIVNRPIFTDKNIFFMDDKLYQINGSNYINATDGIFLPSQIGFSNYLNRFWFNYNNVIQFMGIDDNFKVDTLFKHQRNEGELINSFDNNFYFENGAATRKYIYENDSLIYQHEIPLNNISFIADVEKHVVSVSEDMKQINFYAKNGEELSLVGSRSYPIVNFVEVFDNYVMVRLDNNRLYRININESGYVYEAWKKHLADVDKFLIDNYNNYGVVAEANKLSLFPHDSQYYNVLFSKRLEKVENITQLYIEGNELFLIGKMKEDSTEYGFYTGMIDNNLEIEITDSSFIRIEYDAEITFNGNIALVKTDEEILVFNKDNTVSVENEKAEIIDYKILQNYPNPFNPTTTIRYTVPNAVGDAKYASPTNVTLKVYDILGNEVATLVNEQKPAGNYEVNFKASSLSSGVYFYKIQSGSFTQVRKMLLLK